MSKDFDSWNSRKKLLENRNFQGRFTECEIWWCSFGLNIGHEQDGKNNLYERPAVIIKVFNKEMVIAVPMTLGIRKDLYHFEVADGSLILSQLRLVSTKRFNRYVRRIGNDELDGIKHKLRIVLGL